MKFDVMPVATEKQIKEVEETAKYAWYEHYKDIISQEQIDYMLEHYQSSDAVRRNMSEGYIYYMIMADGELAGYICVLLQSDYALVQSLYIKPEYRRRGLAKRTLAHIDAIFANKEHGFDYIKKLRVNVARKNSFTINVYERLGFEKVRAVDTDIGGGFYRHDYVMERKVKK